MAFLTTTRSMLSTPCTWIRFLARSTPIRVILSMTFPFSDGLPSTNHPGISLCHEIGKVLTNSVSLFADALVDLAFATVVGLRHQPDARTDFAAVVEVPPEHLQGQARSAYFSNSLQTR